MKRSLFIVFLSTLSFSLWAQSDLPSTGNYGESITKKKAVSATSVPEKLQKADKLDLKVKGTIMEVCQNKGCWMTLDLGNGKTMRVTFKDYTFFVPKDVAGKTAWIDGTVAKETMSVAQLQHAAEDAGKTEAEINAIKEPREGITFIARGVIIE